MAEFVSNGVTFFMNFAEPTIYSQQITFSGSFSTTSLTLDINEVIKAEKDTCLRALIKEANAALLIGLELSFGVPLEYWEFDR